MDRPGCRGEHLFECASGTRRDYSTVRIPSFTLRRRRAFTILELIVVMAMILCLFTILLPVLGRAREQGKRAQCLSNLRQLTTAWIAYAEENERYLTGANPPPANSNPPITGWVTPQKGLLGIQNGQIWSYLQTEKVYVCPADQTINNTKTSYQLNGLLNGTIGNPPFHRLDELIQPSKTFVFIEGAPANILNGGQTMELNGVQFRTPIYPEFFFTVRGFPGENHMGPAGHAVGTGLSFADGHAIFWQYSDPRTSQLVGPWFGKTIGNVAAPNSPDVFQLEAWSGGPVPPNATQ